jgi:ferredoxin
MSVESGKNQKGRVKKVKTRFTADPGQTALLPSISGNSINGQGETDFRRPARVYWHNPDAIPHGDVQQWMVDRFNRVEDFREVYASGDRGPKQPDPVVQTRVRDTAQNWSARVKALALEQGANLAGIAELDPDWQFDDCTDDVQPWIIVLGVAMDHERLAQAPSSDEDTVSALEVADKYNRGARAAALTANWIRGQGYYAQSHAGPWAGPITLTPAAMACGLGELGKHGNLINRQYGSSFRLSAVVTDMPLVADVPDDFGADDFCTRCQVCINACPVTAITDDKQMVRGVEKWYVDFDRCIQYFNETHGCGICIAVCPWSRPGTAPKLAEKMLRRRRRQQLK